MFESFCIKNPHLVEALKEIHIKIQDIFGKNILRLNLEYFSDPDEDFENLCIKVDTDLSIDDKLDLIDKFDFNYWLDKDANIRRLITIMV